MGIDTSLLGQTALGGLWLQKMVDCSYGPIRDVHPSPVVLVFQCWALRQWKNCDSSLGGWHGGLVGVSLVVLVALQHLWGST